MKKIVKVTDKVSKKVGNQIKEIGLPLDNPTWDDVFAYLRKEGHYFVHVNPMADGLWEVGIVILGRVNKHDGLLNRCSIAESLPSYDIAIKKGVEFVIQSVFDADRKVKKAKENGTYDKLTKWCEKFAEEEGYI